MHLPTGVEERELISAGVLAPSPDNNQPWRFEFKSGRLLVYLDLRRTIASDVGSMFSLMALGAAIENIRIAARHLGHEIRVQWRFDPLAQQTNSDLALIAELEFENGASEDPLYPYLQSRCTCRKPYDDEREIPAEVVDEVASMADEFDAHIDWIGEANGIRSVSRLIAASDRIRLEYPGFHEEIYRQLRFSAKEADQSRDGLDVRTLELPPGSPLFLKFLKSWRRMHLCNRLGLSWYLGQQAAALVRRSSAVGFLSVAKAEAAEFVQGGRAFQRIWLILDMYGMSVQPLGSLPIFLAHEELLAGRYLNSRHRRIVAQLGVEVRSLVPDLVGRTLLMLFRVGFSTPSKVRSLRRNVDDVIQR